MYKRQTLESEEPDQSIITAFATEAEQANIIGENEIRNDDGEIEEVQEVTASDFATAVEIAEPDPADYGVWVPGIPVLVQSGLDAIHCADWLEGLILDGIVAGVGAVLDVYKRQV